MVTWGLGFIHIISFTAVQVQVTLKINPTWGASVKRLASTHITKKGCMQHIVIYAIHGLHYIYICVCVCE